MQSISGVGLRYLLVLSLLEAGEVLAIGDLVAAVQARGGCLDEGGARKLVSDSLRWEVAKGRVRRVGWGRYAAGHVPRSTQWYMRKRVDEVVTSLRAAAPLPSSEPWPTCSPR